MALAPGFNNSTYLIDSYIKSSVALDEYRRNNNRDALREASGIICDALSLLAGDAPFWSELETVGQSLKSDNVQGQIRHGLADLDLFLSQEGAILREYKFPPTAINNIVQDLSTGLKAFEANPSPELFARLREGTPTAAESMCSLAEAARKEADDGKILGIGIRTREGLAVAGGVTTIVVNGISSAAVPLALCSIIGGAASTLGFLQWLHRRKRRD